MRVERLLELQLGCRRVLLTTSCTHALEMSGLLLEIEPGDEVIVPDYGFVSVPNAFVLRGARPVFADVRPDTLNLDERRLEALITEKTRAIVPIHYGGVACEMDEILALAEKYRLAVIEDNAHGLFATYRGRSLGTLGTMATLSFHETKNFSCGEGGALMINDAKYIERAEIIRDRGTDRSRFFQGVVDKYTWVDIGSSYGLSDLLAAFLLAQLEKRREIENSRRAIWNVFYEALREWARENEIALPPVFAHTGSSHHIFYLILPNPEAQSRFIAHMEQRGIGCVFHYQPLHRSEMGLSLGGAEQQCPVTEYVSQRIVRLPLFNFMSHEQVEQTIEAALTFQVKEKGVASSYVPRPVHAIDANPL